jgi:hypothetical protein
MLSGRSASLLRSAVTPGLGRLLVVVVVVVVHFVLLVDAGPQVNRGVSGRSIKTSKAACRVLQRLTRRIAGLKMIGTPGGRGGRVIGGA